MQKKNHEIAKKAPALPDLSPRSKTVCFEPAGTVKQTLVFVCFFYERRTQIRFWTVFQGCVPNGVLDNVMHYLF